MEFYGEQLLSASSAENVTISVDKAALDSLAPHIDDSKKILEGKCEELRDVNVSYSQVYEGNSSRSYAHAYEVMMYRQENISNQMKLLMELLYRYAV